MHRRQHGAGGEQPDRGAGRQLRFIALAFRGRAQQILSRRERIDQAAGIRDDQHDRAEEAQSIDRRRPRRQAAEQRQIEHRRHDERDDREKEHDRGVGGRRAVERLGPAAETADETRQAEHQQQVADDAAGDGRFDEADVALMERDDGDDQLRRVAERRVEKAAQHRTGPARELLGAQADHAGQRHERDGRRQEDPRRAGRDDDQHPAHRRGDGQEVETVIKEGGERG